MALDSVLYSWVPPVVTNARGCKLKIDSAMHLTQNPRVNVFILIFSRLTPFLMLDRGALAVLFRHSKLWKGQKASSFKLMNKIIFEKEMWEGGWGDVFVFARAYQFSVFVWMHWHGRMCVFMLLLFCLSACSRAPKESVCAREEKKRGRIVKSPPRDERGREGRRGEGGRAEKANRKTFNFLFPTFYCQLLVKIGFKKANRSHL